MIATATSATPRVLFLSPFEPWCRENGSSVVIADLLDGLASSDNVEIFPVFLRRPPAGAKAAAAPAIEGVTLGIDPLPKWYSVPLALGTGRSPWWEVRFNDRAVARRIARLARSRNFEPTVVHVEHLVLVPIGRLLARVFGCPLVYRAHNIESQLYGRLIGRSTIKDVFVRRLQQREAHAIESCDLTLCISDVDLNWARKHAPYGHTAVQPVGLRLDRFPKAPAHSEVVPNRVCFVGGLDWPPNEIGLRWFVEQVFPRIREAVPDVHLAVLARGAEARSWLTENPAIEVLPQTISPVSLFGSSRVSIAPLLEGGGVRVKILESLAAGCCVVATSIGGEGLALSGLVHSDDPAEFADACVNRLREADSIEARDSIRAAVAAKHGAAVVARQLVARWSATSSAAMTVGAR